MMITLRYGYTVYRLTT